MIRRAAPEAVRLRTGPFKGVRATVDIDENVLLSEYLEDALNVYIPDPAGASGVYARPGWVLQNDGTAVHTSAAAFRGQGAFSHTALDGTVYNFVVFEGTLYRVDSTFGAFTDVSPAGITIEDDTTARVYGTSFANQLIVTDGVNRPWLATNLSASPITGTYIDFDGSGTTWAAYGPIVAWGGAIFGILKQYNSVAAQTDLFWSEPGDASTGYQQTGYDNRWTLLQTATDPLFALGATNTRLCYFRARSIGAIAGQVGPDLQTSATHDDVAANVGCTAPQSVQRYESDIYFTDASGRPYRLPAGDRPQDIWKQLRAVVDASSVGFPTVTKVVTTAAIESNLNLYLVAPWSSLASQSRQPVQAQAFDAKSGTYVGPWQIKDGVQLDTLGTLIDSTGRAVLVALGSAAAPVASEIATSGFLWSLNGPVAEGDLLTTEDGFTQLTLEDRVTTLTTEGTEDNWLDDGEAPAVYAVTPRLGYDHEKTLHVDRVTALVGSTAPCEISASTASVPMTVQDTATPVVAQDGVTRAIVGCDGIQGRGAQAKIRPTTADTQWHLQQVVIEATVGLASPEEP